MRLKHFVSMFFMLFALSVGQVWGAKITYTFTSKSWAATVGSTAANWTSGADGGQLTTNQGIQVTSALSGANGTSPVRFVGISKIEVHYCTNATKGAGTIKVQVGSNTEKTFAVTKPSSGGTTIKTAPFNYTTLETGKVKITALCSTNSVYINSVTIYYQTAITLSKNDGASDGSVKINHDATSFVTGTFDEVTRDGFNCTGYWTAASGGTKVLNDDGTFAGANVSVGTTNYITSNKWAYADSTLILHAQWESAGCANSITIGKGSEENGTFTLDKNGSLATCDGLSIVVTPSAAPNYHVKSVSATTGETGTDNGDDTWTITYAANVTGSSTINVVFEEDTKYQITWSINGDESLKTDVYAGAKPVFPSNPASCDQTSNTFYGWATGTWSGKQAAPAETVYTNATDMPAVNAAVTYYAVWAKASAGNAQTYFSEAFGSCESTGGNDNNWSGSIASGTIPSALSDWTFANGNAADGCVKCGSGSKKGSAETPEFTLPGNATLTFRAAAWNGSSEGTRLNLSAANAVLSVDHVTLVKGEWTSYTVNITNVTGAVKIKFEAQNASNNRFFLDEVVVTATSVNYSLYLISCAAAGQCEAPSFDPVAGTYNAAQSVTLSTETDDATIYYTTDGTDPTDASTEYTSPIAVAVNTTIMAIAIKDGMENSEITTGVFNIRCAQPTFSVDPADGPFTTAQSVTLTATDADAIYYTVDGDDPTVDDNLYTGAIVLDAAGTHTIKAMAVRTGYTNSEVATAAYEMDLPYGSIAEFVAAKPSTAEDLVLDASDNCVITAINGNSVFVQDASGVGMIIYNYSGFGALTFAVGDRIVGTINGKYQAFNGQHEMSSATFADGVSFTAVDRPTPVGISAINADAFAAHTMVLVKVQNLYYQSTPSNKNYNFTADANGEQAVQLVYDQFGMIAAHTMVDAGTKCDITGILTVYAKDNNPTKYQLLPVLVTDIEADAYAAAPTFAPEGGVDADNAVMVDLNQNVEITPAANTTINKNHQQIASVDPVGVTVVASRDFYRNTTVTKWYYGDATSQAYDINGIGAITGGAITATVNSQNTTTAEADATVTLAITVEEHFTFASISVRDADNEPVDVTPVTVGQEYTFTMPAKAVTVSVGLTEETKYALTFAKGAEDASGSAPQMSAPSYYEGAQVTLPANTFTYASHKFKGWKIGNTIYAAGATYTMTAEATEAVAQWRTLPDFAAGDWVLVENASELTEESYVIIAASGADFAMKSYASGNNCKAKAAVKNGNLIEYDSEFAVYAILAGNQDNTIAFYDDAIDKYIYAESSTSNNMKAEEALSGNSSWTIDITDGVATLDAQGTNTRNRMRYNPNNNSPIFSCYASISTTGTLVALYKYEAPAFKLIYDKNTDAAVTMPAYQRADNENKVTVTSDQPSRANYVFDGWKDAQQNEYAAGQVLTLDNDLTLYAQWRTAMPYTVSYDANGGQGTMDDVENVIEGTSYTILDNAFTYDETHTFMGWKAYDALNNELTIENGAFTMPSSDVVVKAQWHEIVISDFTLVTNVNQLKDGDKVYIVAAGSDYAMGAQDNTNYRSRVEIGKTTGNERVVIVGGAPVEFTLGKSGDNFTFYDGTGYLAATSSASNYLGTQTDLDDNGKWTIAISNTQEEGYVATIVAQGNYTRNHMQYNASPNQERFSCYGSSNTMKGVAIYRKPADQVSVRNVTPGKYGTICLEKNVVSFTGATMYSIDSKASDLSYITLEEETGALEAGRPYIFLATGSEIKVQYGTTTTADAGSYYGLVGSFTREQLAEGMYIIQNNKFYRTGADNYVGAHKAYINMGGVPEEGETAHVPGRRYVTMQIGDVQTPTALDEVTVNQENAKFILNGQLYILRDGKLYNAQGQLVK